MRHGCKYKGYVDRFFIHAGHKSAQGAAGWMPVDPVCLINVQGAHGMGPG